jgi:hypothetical protein
VHPKLPQAAEVVLFIKAWGLQPQAFYTSQGIKTRNREKFARLLKKYFTSTEMANNWNAGSVELGTGLLLIMFDLIFDTGVGINVGRHQAERIVSGEGKSGKQKF